MSKTTDYSFSVICILCYSLLYTKVHMKFM